MNIQHQDFHRGALSISLCNRRGKGRSVFDLAYLTNCTMKPQTSRLHELHTMGHCLHTLTRPLQKPSLRAPSLPLASTDPKEADRLVFVGKPMLKIQGKAKLPRSPPRSHRPPPHPIPCVPFVSWCGGEKNHFSMGPHLFPRTLHAGSLQTITSSFSLVSSYKYFFVFGGLFFGNLQMIKDVNYLLKASNGVEWYGNGRNVCMAAVAIFVVMFLRGWLKRM